MSEATSGVRLAVSRISLRSCELPGYVGSAKSRLTFLFSRIIFRVSLAHRGASSRDDPEGGAGRGARGPARNRHSGGSGTPSGRHYDRSARSLAGLDRGNPSPGSTTLEPKKPPRWSAERRCASRQTRAAPRQVRKILVRRSALRPPRFSEGEKEEGPRPGLTKTGGGALAAGRFVG